jgi:hypothetical protein
VRKRHIRDACVEHFHEGCKRNYDGNQPGVVLGSPVPVELIAGHNIPFGSDLL